MPANMGLPQAGLDKLISAFYHYQSLGMGLDRFLIRCGILLRS